MVTLKCYHKSLAIFSLLNFLFNLHVCNLLLGMFINIREIR